MKNIYKIGTFVILVSVLFFGFSLLLKSNVFADNNSNAPVCPGNPHDSFRCHARVVTDDKGQPQASSNPRGYGPAQFLGAYNLTGQASGNPVIAIVDAYNHPNILSDLNTYSAQFGIPQLSNCSGPIAGAAGPCFQKVDQRGGTAYPQTNAGWALEIALDVEAAHAVCQNCKILLVEADSNSYTNLMAAIDQARALGADVISNSYGSSEFSGENTYDSHFSAGPVYTFSSGDSGYGSSYPAASPLVTSVGGTTLNLSGNSYVSESVWSGTGSGCSLYEPQPAWQTSLGLSGCSNRIIADVSADADPNTGAAVYDSVRYQGKKGWFQVGGTSLSSPLIAGVYALSGNFGNGLPYSQGIVGTNLHDITNGSNGSCGIYLCTAGAGYDGPTGLGTPKGIGAF